MNQVIIHIEGDGVAVIHPAQGTTVEQMVAAVPEGAQYKVIDAADLPEDRYFRSAWDFNAEAGCTINVEKAKDVQRDVWRKARAPKLAALDIELMKAVEIGDQTAVTTIASTKQQLRDVTLTPLPNEIEAIKATIPEILI